MGWARLTPKIEMPMFAPIRIMAKIARYQVIMSTYDKVKLRQVPRMMAAYQDVVETAPVETIKLMCARKRSARIIAGMHQIRLIKVTIPLRRGYPAV